MDGGRAHESAEVELTRPAHAALKLGTIDGVVNPSQRARLVF
jgi:hypothetical protein